MNIVQESERDTGPRGLGTAALSLWKARPSASLRIWESAFLPAPPLFSLKETPTHYGQAVSLYKWAGRSERDPKVNNGGSARAILNA